MGSACKCLGRAITVEPDTGYSKYFTLAQLMNGGESADLYRKGCDILNSLLQQQHNQEDESRYARDLSCGFISLVELYTTDLCDEDDAEAKCNEYVEAAIKADDKNPEAYQCKANLRLITNHIEEAKEVMKMSVSLWLPHYLGVREGRIEGDSINVCPLSYSARVAAAKICTEIEEYNTVQQICDSLIDDDDSQVEVWYIHGWSNYLRGEDYHGNAKYYLEKAKEVNKVHGVNDPDMMNHIDELLTHLKHTTPDDDEVDNDDAGEDE